MTPKLKKNIAQGCEAKNKKQGNNDTLKCKHTLYHGISIFFCSIYNVML